jgi:membrane-associated protease RseP (regulator of RpoE activity)
VTTLAPAPLPAAPEQAPHPGEVGGAIDWAGLAKMLIGTAVVCGLFIAAGLSALLIVIVAIIVMVMVHELGHFATAKWAGMKVTEYFVGFGPRLWSIRKGETDYGFKPILLGGYVKIIGMTSAEEVHPDDEPRSYRQQPFGKRIIVASAGSFMHFVMAFFLLWVAILAFGVGQGNRAQIAGYEHWNSQPTVAQLAHLKVGDTVVGINGHLLNADGADQLAKIVNHSAGRAVHLTVDRGNQVLHVTVVPALGHLENGNEVLGVNPKTGKYEGFIGAQYVTGTTPEGPIRALGTAAIALGTVTAHTVTAIPHAFANAFSSLSNPKVATATAQSGDRPQSIFGAGRFAVEALHQGVLYLILVLVLLNIGFALLNMLPMLPLDGGHVAIAGYEWIRTKRGRPRYRADVTKMMPIVYGFVALLLVFSLSILYLDIVHPVSAHFSH